MSEEVEFVKMVKDGVYSEVHPTTVQSHQAAGWFVVGEEPVVQPKKNEQFVIKDSEQ